MVILDKENKDFYLNVTFNCFKTEFHGYSEEDKMTAIGLAIKKGAKKPYLKPCLFHKE